MLSVYLIVLSTGLSVMCSTSGAIDQLNSSPSRELNVLPEDRLTCYLLV